MTEIEILTVDSNPCLVATTHTANVAKRKVGICIMKKISESRHQAKYQRNVSNISGTKSGLL